MLKVILKRGNVDTFQGTTLKNVTQLFRLQEQDLTIDKRHFNKSSDDE